MTVAIPFQGVFYPSGRQPCVFGSTYKNFTRQVTRQNPSGQPSGLSQFRIRVNQCASVVIILGRNDAIGRAVPLTPSFAKSATEGRPALSPRRTGHRFRLEEPFGVYNRGRVWEAKRGRRCALPPHSIELN